TTLTWGSCQASLDLRQGREHDISDNLKASGADSVQRISRPVPVLEFEVDDVDRWDARFQEGQVIVLDSGGTLRTRIIAGTRHEVVVQLQTLRGSPNRIRQPRRRVRVPPDVQITVGDHVDQNQRLQAR